MTKKDYILLADAIKTVRNDRYHDPNGNDAEACITLEALTRYLVDALKEDNERFDEKRFRDACQGNDLI